MFSVIPVNIKILCLTIWLLGYWAVAAGEGYAVSSFTLLPDDITGFMEPVKDLNGEDCALLKIQAPPEFVFSTPLGIVKRIDSVGEILLYIPAGSKKLTFKHPEWGVLRNYAFPESVVGKSTYEIKMTLPSGKTGPVKRDTVYTMLRDTLVLSRTDTVVLPQRKATVPLSAHLLATVTFGGKAKILSAGIMGIVMKRHGGFLHLTTDFGKKGEVSGECDRYGTVGGYLPFYSGKKRHSSLTATVGAIHTLSASLRIFEGIGYGYGTVAWELAPSEGGGYVKNSYYSSRGAAIEIGALYCRRRISLAASLLTINGSQWYGNIGIGVRIGK